MQRRGPDPICFSTLILGEIAGLSSVRFRAGKSARRRRYHFRRGGVSAMFRSSKNVENCPTNRKIAVKSGRAALKFAF